MAAECHRPGPVAQRVLSAGWYTDCHHTPSEQEQTMPPMPLAPRTRRTRLEDVRARDLVSPDPVPVRHGITAREHPPSGQAEHLPGELGLPLGDG
jgi:hypothetical protein